VQMFRGLEYMHKIGLAHCNIKSSNVFLQHVGESSNANGRGD